MRKSTARDRIELLVDVAREGLTGFQIMEITGVPPGQFYQVMEEMVESSKVLGYRAAPDWRHRYQRNPEYS